MHGVPYWAGPIPFFVSRQPLSRALDSVSLSCFLCHRNATTLIAWSIFETTNSILESQLYCLHMHFCREEKYLLMALSGKLRWSHDSSSPYWFTDVNYQMQSGLQHRDGHIANINMYPDDFLLPVMTRFLALHYTYWKITTSSALWPSRISRRELLQVAAWPVYAFQQFPARRKYEVAVYPSNNLKHD